MKTERLNELISELREELLMVDPDDATEIVSRFMEKHFTADQLNATIFLMAMVRTMAIENQEISHTAFDVLREEIRKKGESEVHAAERAMRLQQAGHSQFHE